MMMSIPKATFSKLIKVFKNQELFNHEIDQRWGWSV